MHGSCTIGTGAANVLCLANQRNFGIGTLALSKVRVEHIRDFVSNGMSFFYSGRPCDIFGKI